MLGLIALVISIGIADSVNPATIVVALYLAAGERPLPKVTAFTLGVFTAYLLGGVAVAVGPGQLILANLPRPGHEARSIGKLVVGVLLLVSAGVLWARRTRLRAHQLPTSNPGERSAVLLGAAMTIVELPTAFPYLAAVGAVVDSGRGVADQLLLLVIYNMCFVLPLILIEAALGLAGRRALSVLNRSREWVERHWPFAFAFLALLAGCFVLALGVIGLASAP
jgi:cytochrome c biogenesis protein CcdA